MRLKTGKIDYCKAEGLDNSKSIDAFALVDSIVLQAFETGLRSELQEAVRLRQDDYDNLDEALEIAQTIESVKSSLGSNSQMDKFEYLTAGVAEININRTRTPHGQAGRAARGSIPDDPALKYGEYFFQYRDYQGLQGSHLQGSGRYYERNPEIVIIIRAIEVILIKEGKLNPVDVLSQPPDETLLRTRPFSLADEEAEFFFAVTVQTESTTMNSTSPKGSLDFLGLEVQQIREYQMNDVELAPIISLMLQHGTNDYAKFEFSSTNGDALQRQEDRDAG
ncbi:hypothetical protein QYM36_018892 [Artemia franciscana]|uniref:Uncharacterized protein n=1 Tax=Artemia franciscana TaxID=6661 RepID=A0AA88HBT4_ARTSF|nr:hypothetical protein QYM36_018892 [Artemia franciscana]